MAQETSEKAAQNNAKNRRRILLINPRFQISVMVHGLLLIVLITAMFYFYETFFLYQVNEIVHRHADVPPSLAGDIENLHSMFFPWFVLILFATSFVIMSFLLFFSHRIAGPIYHAVNYLNAVAKNPNVIRKVGFREKDYFHELADAINLAIPKPEKKD